MRLRIITTEDTEGHRVSKYSVPLCVLRGKYWFSSHRISLPEREPNGPGNGACVILREGELVHYSREDAIAPLWAGQRFPITDCISGWTILHRAPVIIEDIYSDERVPVDYYRSTFVKSLAMVPIQQDNPAGAIGVYWARQHKPTEHQLDLLEALADLAAVAFVNVQLFDEMKSARLDAEARAEELRKQASRHRLSDTLWASDTGRR